MESFRPSFGFKSLKVYQHAMNTSFETNKVCKMMTWGCQLYLRDQLLRSTSSVGANIAEGHSRESNKDAARFWMIAKASAAEASHHISELKLLGVMSEQDANNLLSLHEITGKMLRRLIQSRLDDN